MLRVTARQQLMKEIVDLLSVLTEEAKLSWGESGLKTTVVDGSHVGDDVGGIGDTVGLDVVGEVVGDVVGADVEGDTVGAVVGEKVLKV